MYAPSVISLRTHSPVPKKIRSPPLPISCAQKIPRAPLPIPRSSRTRKKSAPPCFPSPHTKKIRAQKIPRAKTVRGISLLFRLSPGCMPPRKFLKTATLPPSFPQGYAGRNFRPFILPESLPEPAFRLLPLPDVPEPPAPLRLSSAQSRGRSAPQPF